MPTYADIPVLTASLLTTEAQIDRALDTRNKRAFKLWCQRRTSIATRLQRALLTLASC